MLMKVSWTVSCIEEVVTMDKVENWIWKTRNIHLVFHRISFKLKFQCNWLSLWHGIVVAVIFGFTYKRCTSKWFKYSKKCQAISVWRILINLSRARRVRVGIAVLRTLDHHPARPLQVIIIIIGMHQLDRVRIPRWRNNNEALSGQWDWLMVRE